jgi:hypothetical protein
MNQLSWLLYWADVLPQCATAVALFATILALFSAAMTVLYFTAGLGEWQHDRDYTARFRYFPFILALALVLGIASNLVPSKDTFYLIAASETGKQALETPEVSKVRAVINKWLDKDDK